MLGEDIQVTGAGRTDTGVHAKEYYAHFNSLKNNLHLDLQFLFRLNSFLPQDIAVSEIIKTTEDAHARFDAISRTYNYFITKIKDPFLQKYFHFVYGSLNIDSMNNAAGMIRNYNDFTSFSKIHANNKNSICKISECEWIEKENQLIFKITSDRFLRGMVRLITGTMIQVGLNKMTLSRFKDILESQSHGSTSFSMPPCGLFLTEIKYPDQIFIHESN